MWFREEPGGFDAHNFDYSRSAEKVDALGEFTTTVTTDSRTTLAGKMFYKTYNPRKSFWGFPTSLILSWKPLHVIDHDILKSHPMFSLSTRTLLLVLASVFCVHQRLCAQLPFYTDDTGVTDPNVLHFEFFNEYDTLQLQYPNQRQNTANFKLNYGLPHHLELDIDAPYLTIQRSQENQASSGGGDTNMGIKWAFHQESKGSHAPALAASLYIEFPTGDASQQLGSGLTDYWLNFIMQKSLSEKTRVNSNFGLLFAGNTSTGVLGTQNTRGQVYVGGLSLLHDFTSRLTLGGEMYGAYAKNDSLGRGQFQGMLGGQFAISKKLSLCFGVLGGKYVASPQIGGQIGFAVDFPSFKGTQHGH